MKLLIYLPALNEAETIHRVIEELPKALDKIDLIRYLVIDDGSSDATRERALAAGAEVISHDQNRGVGAAFHSAAQFALESGADILVGIDSDGQFDAREIPNLIAPIVAGQAEMVVGNRFASGMPVNMAPIKYWGNRQVAKLISYVGNREFQDVSCGFRAYSREALLRFNLFGLFTYTHETILSLVYQGQRVLELPVSVSYHLHRKSRVADSVILYAFRTSAIILRVMIDYKPMRLFGAVGSILVSIGAVFTLFLLAHYAVTGSFTPYKSFGFIGLGFFIFGLLVLLFALIADMINRVRINQDRQLYQLRKLRYDKHDPSR
jgi:glycosyltransferase involved in cell wall biosynthesis